MVRFFPKNVEYSWWDWVKIFISLLFIGFVAGSIFTTIAWKTDWFQLLGKLIGFKLYWD